MAALESLFSTPVTAMAGDTLAPAKVLNVRYTVEQGKVHLSWDPVTTNADGSTLTDLAGYRIYRKNDATSALALVGNVSTTVDSQVTIFSDTTMLDGASYIYVVTAIDNETTPNESVASDELAVKTIPSVPLNLAATSGDQLIHLTWDSVKDANQTKKNENLAGYKIYRKLSSDSEYTFLAQVSGDVTVYNDTTVVNNQSYNYVVTSIDNSL